MLHWYDPATPSIKRPVIWIRRGTHGTYPAQNVDSVYFRDWGCGSVNCGIVPHDDAPAYSSGTQYVASWHAGHDLIAYWPHSSPPCTHEGCGVPDLAPSFSNGSVRYDLVSFVHSPLWSRRMADGYIYTNTGTTPSVTLAGGEQGLFYFDTYLDTQTGNDHGASPPWIWNGGTKGCFEGPLSTNYCTYAFGADNTNGFYRTPMRFKSYAAGSLLSAPADVVKAVWNLNWSTTYLRNPYLPDSTTKNMNPPMQMSVSGAVEFSAAANQGSWSINVSGGYSPYTYRWTSAADQGMGSTFATTVTESQYLLVEVTDAIGQTLVMQMYLDYCNVQQEGCEEEDIPGCPPDCPDEGRKTKQDPFTRPQDPNAIRRRGRP